MLFQATFGIRPLCSSPSARFPSTLSASQRFELEWILLLCVSLAPSQAHWHWTDCEMKRTKNSITLGSCLTRFWFCLTSTTTHKAMTMDLPTTILEMAPRRTPRLLVTPLRAARRRARSKRCHKRSTRRPDSGYEHALQFWLFDTE